MSSSEHSKTPWFITQSRSGLYIAKDGGGIVACAIDSYCTSLDEAQADAAFIVQCVNAHDELVEALTEVMSWIRNWDPNFSEDDEWPATKAKVRAALEKAGRPS